MTDLLDAAVEFDEGTPGELRPQSSPPPSDEIVCTICNPPKAFEGAGAKGRLAGHKVIVHGFPKAEKKPKPAARRGRPRGSPNQPKPSTPATPKNPALTAPKRKSSVEFFESLASGAGDFLADYGIDRPVGKVLALEAPLLGIGLDEAVEGTIIDRYVVQPAINYKDRFDKVGAPLTLLFGTAILERKPQLWPMLGPGLVWAVDEMLDDLVDAYAKKAKKTEAKKRNAKKLAELSPLFAELFGDNPDADPAQVIIDAIFAPEPGDDAVPA